jgi:hypothetical protein
METIGRVGIQIGDKFQNAPLSVKISLNAS